MTANNSVTSQEMGALVQELEEISEDLSTYFEFCQNRQAILQDLLTKSTLN